MSLRRARVTPRTVRAEGARDWTPQDWTPQDWTPQDRTPQDWTPQDWTPWCEAGLITAAVLIPFARRSALDAPPSGQGVTP